MDGEYVEVYNTNRINLTIELTTLGAVDVYCLAPVWNSTDWVNQSISINVLPGKVIAKILASKNELLLPFYFRSGASQLCFH